VITKGKVQEFGKEKKKKLRKSDEIGILIEKYKSMES